MNLGDRIKWALVRQAILSALNWVADWLSRLKRKDQPEPIETDLPPADRAGTFTRDIPAKPRVKRTAKRAPPEPPKSLASD